MKTLEGLKHELQEDPEVKRAYDAMEPEFSIARELVGVRAANSLKWWTGTGYWLSHGKARGSCCSRTRSFPSWTSWTSAIGRGDRKHWTYLVNPLNPKIPRCQISAVCVSAIENNVARYFRVTAKILA